MMKYFRKFTIALLVIGSSLGAHAEDAIPTTLDFSEVPRFGGQWKVTLDLNGNEMDFYLTVSDLDGKVGATIDTERQPETRAIEKITHSTQGVDFVFNFAMADQSFVLHLLVKEAGRQLTGTLTEENGLFSGAVTGERGSINEAEIERKAPTEARLRLDGKKIRVTFGSLEQDSKDYSTLSTLASNSIYTYAGSRATKLFTDMDLKFGNEIVKANNIAENYPGVYSLWLKRNGDSWALVFNEQPDVWGTQHNAKFDVATIPLTSKTTDTAQENFLVTLEEKANGGQLKMAWGNKTWSTPFELVQ
jgi:hypothetical protein